MFYFSNLLTWTVRDAQSVDILWRESNLNTIHPWLGIDESQKAICTSYSAVGAKTWSESKNFVLQTCERTKSAFDFYDSWHFYQYAEGGVAVIRDGGSLKFKCFSNKVYSVKIPTFYHRTTYKGLPR